jgi:hypothetical protein
VKEGGGAEGECERERALGVLLCYSLGHWCIGHGSSALADGCGL